MHVIEHMLPKRQRQQVQAKGNIDILTAHGCIIVRLLRPQGKRRGHMHLHSYNVSFVQLKLATTDWLQRRLLADSCRNSSLTCVYQQFLTFPQVSSIQTYTCVHIPKLPTTHTHVQRLAITEGLPLPTTKRRNLMIMQHIIKTVRCSYTYKVSLLWAHMGMASWTLVIISLCSGHGSI